MSFPSGVGRQFASIVRLFFAAILVFFPIRAFAEPVSTSFSTTSGAQVTQQPCAATPMLLGIQVAEVTNYGNTLNGVGVGF